MPVPPHTGTDSTHEIHHCVPRIASCSFQQVWTDHFEKNRPENGVERDFVPSWRLVVGTEPQSALHPKQHRQRARNEKHVIEMEPQEKIVGMGPNHPAIERIQGAANEEQTVAQIGKRFHNSTKIAIPKAVATSSFKTNIMPTTLHYLSRAFQNIFLTIFLAQKPFQILQITVPCGTMPFLGMMITPSRIKYNG